VYHLAGEFAKHLQAQMKIDTCAGADEGLWKFTEQEVLCAEIAGLCHDLGVID
jgi:HD superfamily phosphohydrolase